MQFSFLRATQYKIVEGLDCLTMAQKQIAFLLVLDQLLWELTRQVSVKVATALVVFRLRWRLIYNVTLSNEPLSGVPVDLRDSRCQFLSTIITLFHVAPRFRDVGYHTFHPLSPPAVLRLYPDKRSRKGGSESRNLSCPLHLLSKFLFYFKPVLPMHYPPTVNDSPIILGHFPLP